MNLGVSSAGSSRHGLAEGHRIRRFGGEEMTRSLLLAAAETKTDRSLDITRSRLTLPPTECEAIVDGAIESECG